MSRNSDRQLTYTIPELHASGKAVLPRFKSITCSTVIYVVFVFIFLVCYNVLFYYLFFVIHDSMMACVCTPSTGCGSTFSAPGLVRVCELLLVDYGLGFAVAGMSTSLPSSMK